MNKEKDFFKTCFNTVAGLEVKNESQAIAKEVILSEIEDLQQENKQLKVQIKEYQKALDETMPEKIDIENNWNKLKEWVRKDNNCFETLFYMGRCVNFQCILDKMQEIEQGSGGNE